MFERIGDIISVDSDVGTFKVMIIMYHGDVMVCQVAELPDHEILVQGKPLTIGEQIQIKYEPEK